MPNPTARKKNSAQTDVTTSPIGKKARVVPGMTNGAADWAAADADAAAFGPVFVEALAKTPLTKDASPEDSVAATFSFVMGLRAARSIWGISRG